MENNFQILSSQTLGINWNHFAVVLSSIVLFLGLAWMKEPQLFSSSFAKKKNTANVPKYYAYVQPEGDAMPLVLGANTSDAPSVINEDGTVSQVDIGEVLGAATEDVKLSLDSVKVKNIVPDSEESVMQYLTQSQALETGSVGNIEFETALSSNNQEQINKQAAKLLEVRNKMLALEVPVGLVKLQKLKILQFNSAVGILENFTKADENPQLVGNYLNEFLKSQQDLDIEMGVLAKKYNLDDSLFFSSSLGNANVFE